MSDMIQRRHRARVRFADCDRNIDGWEQVARGRSDQVPAMEAAVDQRDLSGSAEITVSVEWLSWMFDFLAEYDGGDRSVAP